MQNNNLIVMKIDSDKKERTERLQKDLKDTYIRVEWDKTEGAMRSDISGSIESLRFIFHSLAVQDKTLYEKVIKWLVERIEHQRTCSCESCRKWRTGTGFTPPRKS